MDKLTFVRTVQVNATLKPSCRGNLLPFYFGISLRDFHAVKIIILQLVGHYHQFKITVSNALRIFASKEFSIYLYFI